MPFAPTSKSKTNALPFTKMHGLGNDFVLVTKADMEATELGREIASNWTQLGNKFARTLCDRNFGVGADGLILISPATLNNCVVAWNFLNSDGSPSDMCGNGLRCLALWARENNQTTDNEFAIETNLGAMPIQYAGSERITIDLLKPKFEPAKKLTVDGTQFEFTAVNMGNPHCVIFDPAIDENMYAHYATQIQSLSEFPDGVNVEFVKVRKPTFASVTVFERGAGATLACATGAAATLVAGVLQNKLQRTSNIELPGGILEVHWSDKDDHVQLTGPATNVFTGVVDLSLLMGGLT